MISEKLILISHSIFYHIRNFDELIHDHIEKVRIRRKQKEYKKFLLTWKIIDDSGDDSIRMKKPYSIRYFNELYRKLGK